MPYVVIGASTAAEVPLRTAAGVAIVPTNTLVADAARSFMTAVAAIIARVREVAIVIACHKLARGSERSEWNKIRPR